MLDRLASLRALAALSLLVLFAGCAGSGSTTSTAPPPVAVSLSQNVASLGATGSANFTANVANDTANAGVTWSLGSGQGTLSNVTTTSVTYTAPAAAVSGTVTLTATSKTDTTKSASATITINAITVSVGPSNPASMIGGATQTFNAAVSNDASNAGVTWSASVGSITSAGVYAAPAVVSTATATITGTSKTDPSKSASVNVTLNAIAVSFTAGTGLIMDSGQSAAVTASVANDGSASGVTFAASSGGVGAASPGSASVVVAGNSPSTTFFAPTVTSSGSATLTATSVEDPTRAATTTVTVNPAIAISPGSSTGTTTLTAALTNSAYTQTFTKTTGTGTGTFTYAIVSGGTGLPGGLTLSAGGTLSGTLTAAAGTYTFTVKVTDQATTPASVQFNYSLTINAAPLVFNTPALNTGTVGTAYSQQLTATGGTGTLTYAVASGTLPTGITLSSAGLLSGTPTAPTVVAGTPLTFKVTDSASSPVTTTTGSVNLIVNPVTLAITTTTLPTGSLNNPYSFQLVSTGGTGVITWSKISGTFPSGLSVSSTGLISGTPTATTTGTSLTFQAQDSAVNQQQTKTVTLTLVIGTSVTVSGQINSNTCGSGLSGVTVSINTSPVQTTTTNSSGSFTFSNIPAGSYTLTPSITGPSSVFYPATQTITVATSAVNTSFSGALGYTVSGTVNYAGAKTGQIYVALNSTNCGGNYTPGTSLSAKGAFTIRGVPPGSYTLSALMDTLNNGTLNTADPSGSSSGITVSTANITGASVTLSDPTTTTLTTAPGINGVSPFSGGALIQYQPITNSSGVEMATSYTVQWSTNSNFAAIAGSKTFAANGNDGATLWLLNGLTNGSTYYFRAYGTSAGTATSPYSSVSSAVTINAPTAANTISGAVTFTGTATGPLLVGFYNLSTGVFYGQSIASPVSPQAYTVQVPTGSAFYFVGVIDQNNDGIISAGDITDINGGNPPTVAITGSTTSQNLTLNSATGGASALTQNWISVSTSGSSEFYYLQLQAYGILKRPVAVAITGSSNASGANVLTPIDLAVCSMNNGCGGGQGTFYVGTSAPAAGDIHTFSVTYSDGTTGTVTGTVSAVLSAFATNLSPQTGTSLTPTFTWTDPANAGNYTYDFYMNDNNGNQIWQIPGNNSNSSGFASTITSITWGTDPTGGGSTPTVSTLTHGTSYYWSITTRDSAGNEAVKQVPYQP